MRERFPDSLLFVFPKSPGQIARDFKWLSSYRYGILHLGGHDAANLEARCRAASDMLGWRLPQAVPDPAMPDNVARDLAPLAPPLSLETPR